MNSDQAFRKLIHWILWILLAGVAAFLFFRYLLSAVFPFLLAYLIAFSLQPLCHAMEKRAGISRKVTVLVAVCVIVALLLLICVLLFRRLFRELTSLASGLGELLERLRTDETFRNETADRLSALLPIPHAADRVREFLLDVDGRLMDFLGRAAENLSGAVLPFLGGAIRSLPGLLLSVVVVLIASYYFAIDFRGINGKLMALFPAGGQAFLRKGKSLLVETGGKFLRAYGLLMVITFAELFVAFLILGYRYAFLLAAVIALVDILPVLGTGTVLIPWAVFCMFGGNWFDGIGLLIVYAVVTIARQILEPKIVGKYIGLSPLGSLAAMYIGLRLMGFWGLFLLPLGATVGYRFLADCKKQKEEK